MFIVEDRSKPRLSDETFHLLRDLIHKRCGIYFTDVKKYLLENRLLRRLEGRNLKSFEDYYYFLLYDPEREVEFLNLIESIVTNETSFFRDLPQLEAFRKGIVPSVMEYKQKLSKKEINIWSAACSTGEEPFTIAMILLEDDIAEKGWKVEILGSDISEKVLKSAIRGVYEKYSLRNTPERYISRYFSNSGDCYVVNQRVRQLVRYRRINLMDPLETRTVQNMDIIFCRNVLIYFNDQSKRKVLNHLYDSLVEGGYLILGFSETLHNITRLFKPVSFERSVVYQKV